MEFKELGLTEEVMAGIEAHGFESMTDVQEKVIPVALTGRDIMAQSKTGSGKTLVFLTTIFEKHVKNPESRAIVIAPTRELADQIEKDAISFSKGLKDYTVGCFYGGVGYEKQSADLEKGVDLVVGTPGRLLDFSKSKKLDFSTFDTVVLDEADRMFDMGFYPDIQEMFNKMRKSEERQTMLFSATLSTKVRNLAWAYMNEPEEFDVQPEEITVKNITQELFHVTKEEKFGVLLSIFKKLSPKSAIIFTNTKDKAVEVSERLNMNGYKTSYLMGDMAQSVRLKTLENLKKGKIEALIATDVAARGLQVDDLELVVNYDIPEDYENYVHRIGRTARAGKSGKAITLACEEYIYGLEAIETYIQMKIPVLWTDEVGLEAVLDKSEGYRIRRRRAGDAHAQNKRRESPRKGEYRKSGKKKSTSSINKKEGAKPSKKRPSGVKKTQAPLKKSAPVKRVDTLSKEIQGKNVRKVSLSSIPVEPKKKGILSRIKDFFRKK